MKLLQFACAFCVLGSVLAADGVVFPDHRRKSHKGDCAHCAQPIPISLARQLSNVDTSEQFLRQFVENGGEISLAEGLRTYGVSFRSPFAQTTDATKRVSPANCKPELRTISLKESNDPTLIYYPTCVRLEQCGGCCNHELLECQANQTSSLNVTVMMTKYMGNKTLKYIGKKTVTLVKHEMCACDCKSKPKDCRGRQIYRKNECRCVCADEQEELECAAQPNKLWDPSTCQCSCRDAQECSSGYVFDSNSCKCDKMQQWRSYDSYRFHDKI